MASYYDSNKYSLVKKYTGEFRSDRPFQILVFKNLFDQSGTIFINCHNPHGYTFKQLESHFSREINDTLISEEKTYRIIAVGDFNKTSWSFKERAMIKKSWIPLSGEGVSTPITIASPVISCAVDGKWEGANLHDYGMRGGDYVFDSKSVADIQVPPKYSYDRYLSDHLPVIALLPQ